MRANSPVRTGYRTLQVELASRTLRRGPRWACVAHAGDALCMRALFIESDPALLAARGLSINKDAPAFLRSMVLCSWRAAARRKRKGTRRRRWQRYL